MIYYMVPYSVEKKLGIVYNQYVNLVPNNSDWVCLMDADTCFLTPNYGHQINEIVEKYPNVGIFTCLTNRIKNLSQRYNGIISENADFRFHIEIANQLQREKYTEVTKINRNLSGFLLLFRKSTWQALGGFDIIENFLKIDNKFSRKALEKGFTIMRMEGVYIWHTYRLLEGIKNKEHLK